MGLAQNLLYICEPNEVLIFSGRRRRTDGGVKGYRIIKGGRGWRIPLIERVDRLDLTNMIIEVEVKGAYSKGGHSAQCARASPTSRSRATSRYWVQRWSVLLGQNRGKSIVQMAKDVLEGNLRGVLSRLTPEEVNEDKLAFAEKLLEEAEHDLGRLGLLLDTMKIQNVWDERGYLDSIGRQAIRRDHQEVPHRRGKGQSGRHHPRRRQPAASPRAAGRSGRADRGGPGRATRG